MAIHRPKNVEPQFEIPDVKFIDDMVRASLQMNPQLRQGMSTSTYLNRMRKQAVDAMQKKAAPAKAAATTATAKTDDDRRKQTINMFLGLKRDDLEKELASIRERQQALANEENAIKERCIEEVIDHLIVVCSGGKSLSVAQDCLKSARSLLAQLDVSEGELLRRARR